MVGILGVRLWLALELLRGGTGTTAELNPITIIVAIHNASEPDWTGVREKTVDLLKTNPFKDITVEIGRGSIYCTAQKHTRILTDNGYKMKAGMGRYHASQDEESATSQVQDRRVGVANQSPRSQSRHSQGSRWKKAETRAMN